MVGVIYEEIRKDIQAGKARHTEMGSENASEVVLKATIERNRERHSEPHWAPSLVGKGCE